MSEIEKSSPVQIISGGDIENLIDYRKKLIKEYHDGSGSLAEKLQKLNKNNLKDLVMALVDETVKESDNLLGNELIVTQNGDLAAATIISTKRADVIQSAIKAIQAKQTLEQDNELDVDSPYMRIIFRYFMKKVFTVFEKLNYGNEISDPFYRALEEDMQDYRRELKEEFSAMKVLNTGDDD